MPPIRAIVDTLVAKPAVLALCVVAITAAVPTTALGRALELDRNAMVEMEIATVMLDPIARTPMVLLRDPEEGDLLPIMIGVAEARAILLALQGAEVPRPMTHDLFYDVIEILGATLTAVYVDDLNEGTYLGALELQLAGDGGITRIDSRPSDAMALALRAHAPIFVAPKLLEAVRDRDLVPLDEQQVAVAVGITVIVIDDEVRSSRSLPDQPGVLVREARGRAAEAGVTAGMMILRVNGQAVDAPLGFLERVGDVPAREPVRLHTWHEGEEREIVIPPDPSRIPDSGPRIRA